MRNRGSHQRRLEGDDKEPRTKAAIPHFADWLWDGMARKPMRKSTIVLASIVELNIVRRPNLLTV